MEHLNEQVIHDSSEHSKLPELFESYLSSPSSPHASKSLGSCSSLLLTLLCIKEGERERGRGRRREERGGRRGEGGEGRERGTEGGTASIKVLQTNTHSSYLVQALVRISKDFLCFRYTNPFKR